MPGVLARAAGFARRIGSRTRLRTWRRRFHRFYTECRVVGDDAALTQARLWLCRASQQVLANLLEVLGVSAPERMDRDDA